MSKENLYRPNKFTGNLFYGSLSQIFHENTKNFSKSNKVEVDHKKLIPQYDQTVEHIHFKSYPRFKKISITNKFSKGKDLEKTLTESRSTTVFGTKKTKLDEISKILFFSAGINFKKEEDDWDNSLRPYPSLGMRYPLELYLAVLQNSELKPGIYHYNVKYNVLEQVMQDDIKEKISAAFYDGELLENASLIFLISAIFKRNEIKYGDRGYRYTLFEAGHLAQNIYLMANSMSLGTFNVGEFVDGELNKIVDIDGVNESVLYAIVVGSTKRFSIF